MEVEAKECLWAASLEGVFLVLLLPLRIHE